MNNQSQPPMLKCLQQVHEQNAYAERKAVEIAAIIPVSFQEAKEAMKYQYQHTAMSARAAADWVIAYAAQNGRLPVGDER